MGAPEWVTAGAAVVTAIVTGVYAFFTWRLWQETRRQADLTKGLAEATKQQASITQTMLEVSQKPNVVLDLFLDIGTTPDSFYIETTVHNYGPAPAVVTGAEVRLVDGERELGRQERTGGTSLYIVPGRTESLPWHFGDSGMWGALKRFTLEATVTYKGPLKAYAFRALAPLLRPEVHLTVKHPLKVERSNLLELPSKE